MKNSKKKSFLVAIRAAGERTRNACQEIVARQAVGQQVVVIQEKPFKKALEACFQTAIDHQVNWLVTVDADMLLLPGAIETLLNHAEKMPGHYFQLQGRIIDKITGRIRKAGPRIYRVRLLPEALDLSGNSEDRIRPEAHVVMAMGERGYPSRYIPDLTCFHDFEQYYSDLYRKSVAHAGKHQEFLGTIIKQAASRQKQDTDYKVILKGIWDGLVLETTTSADSRRYAGEAKKALKELGLDEKNSTVTAEEIRTKQEQWLRDILPEAVNKSRIDIPKPEYPLYRRFKHIIDKMGVINGLRFMAGEILKEAGEKLKPSGRG